MGWRMKLSDIFQAGPWGHKEPKTPHVVSQYEALERVNTWRRSSGLQPREVKRQHMYLHMSRHPRGPEELILTPPLPPCCRLAAPASLPVVSVQNLKKEKKIIAVPETIRVNYSLQMPAGQWERCFVL